MAKKKTDWIDIPGLENILEKEVPLAGKLLAEGRKHILVRGQPRIGKSHIRDRICETSKLEILGKIIKICAERDVRVHMINFPTFVSYRENLNPIKYNMIIDTCSWMSREFENVYHFKIDGDPRFTAEDFFDGDHLNDAGAMKCSQLVNDYIESIKINPDSPRNQKSF